MIKHDNNNIGLECVPNEILRCILIECIACYSSCNNKKLVNTAQHCFKHNIKTLRCVSKLFNESILQIQKYNVRDFINDKCFVINMEILLKYLINNVMWDDLEWLFYENHPRKYDIGDCGLLCNVLSELQINIPIISKLVDIIYNYYKHDSKLLDINIAKMVMRTGNIDIINKLKSFGYGHSHDSPVYGDHAPISDDIKLQYKELITLIVDANHDDALISRLKGQRIFFEVLSDLVSSDEHYTFTTYNTSTVLHDVFKLICEYGRIETIVDIFSGCSSKNEKLFIISRLGSKYNSYNNREKDVLVNMLRNSEYVTQFLMIVLALESSSTFESLTFYFGTDSCFRAICGSVNCNSNCSYYVRCFLDSKKDEYTSSMCWGLAYITCDENLQLWLAENNYSNTHLYKCIVDLHPVHLKDMTNDETIFKRTCRRIGICRKFGILQRPDAAVNFIEDVGKLIVSDNIATRNLIDDMMWYVDKQNYDEDKDYGKDLVDNFFKLWV